MTRILESFEARVAARVLARAALALDSSSQNPATNPVVDDELAIRNHLISEARADLGIAPDDVSDRAIQAICDKLDEAADQLAVKPDLERAALRLAMRGELPSDRFNVNVVPNLAEVYEPHFENEVRRIKNTVYSPEIEQHFGPPKRIGEPALISLFLRYYPSPYPYRGFYHLVAANRVELTLIVHQAWRLYPSVMQVTPSTDLVGLLRTFADTYGSEVSVEGVRGKMIVNAPLAAGRRSITIEWQDQLGPKADRRITTWFTQKEENGEIRGSLILSINYSQYRKVLNRMRWEEDLFPNEGPNPDFDRQVFLSRFLLRP